MFVDPTSLLWNKARSDKQDYRYYWVDGDMLRKFVGCQSDLDELLKSTNPIVCHWSKLCPHGQLSPGTASRGKVLPKPLYDAYVSLLDGERKLIHNTGPDSRINNIIGCIVEPTTNLLCDICSLSYKKNVSEKVEFIQNVKNLYIAVADEKSDKETLKGEEYMFVVSRSSITQFKKLASAMMKSVATIDEGVILDDTYGASSNKLPLHGIDEIDISCFKSKNFTISSVNNEMDERLNRKITCMYLCFLSIRFLLIHFLN
jgi:hypothetical protein